MFPQHLHTDQPLDIRVQLFQFRQNLLICVHVAIIPNVRNTAFSSLTSVSSAASTAPDVSGFAA
jgi:hypothetical protein